MVQRRSVVTAIRELIEEGVQGAIPAATGRGLIVVCIAVSVFGLQGCFATDNVARIGRRWERGVVTSADDMSLVGPKVIFHSSVVETCAIGGITFSGESRPYRVVRIERDRPWWAGADREDFKRNTWRARSLQVHLEALPSTALEGAGRESQRHEDPSGAPGEDTCYSVTITNIGTMYLTTCDGKLIGRGAENSVELRSYRAWWGYPARIVAFPLAIGFDTLTFPLQLYAYLSWNNQRHLW